MHRLSLAGRPVEAGVCEVVDDLREARIVVLIEVALDAQIHILLGRTFEQGHEFVGDDPPLPITGHAARFALDHHPDFVGDAGVAQLDPLTRLHLVAGGFEFLLKQTERHGKAVDGGGGQPGI